MQVTAHLHALRIAPRKVRAVTRLLKGRDAATAEDQLRYLAKRTALPLQKLLNSALANAENNFGLVKSNMRIKDLMVNGGPVLKRFEPKGFGSVSPIAKRTSHVTVILEEKVPGLKADPSSAKASEGKTKKLDVHDHKHETKKELGPKEGAVKKFTRKMFQRKSI